MEGSYFSQGCGRIEDGLRALAAALIIQTLMKNDTNFLPGARHERMLTSAMAIIEKAAR